MTRVRTAVVIGGGIAGPVAALALRRAGIEATVYERYPTTADGLGGRIALAPNGLAALDLVGAADATVAAGQPIDRQVMAIRGNRIALPALPGAGPLQVISRGDLYGILRDRGAPTTYGKELVDVRESAAGVTAIFADGTSATADVLIGADGVHSKVRRLIDPAAPGPLYTGMLAVEGHSAEPVDGDPRTVTFAFGHQAYYLYWPADGGGTIWGANLPTREPMPIAQARARPAERWREVLLETYGDDAPGGALIRRTPAETFQVNGALHIMPPVPHWSRGRMVLVGDAVHAPSNSSGQGASLAIESAVQLARCLRDLEIPEAFEAYERLRRARVESIAARAAKINHVKAPGPVGQMLMPIAMRAMMRFAMKPEKMLGPVLRYRIDFDAPVGRDLSGVS